MSAFRRTVRQALTVARRDFIATVFAPTFLIFLLSPMLMLAFGAIGGSSAASVAADSSTTERLVALVAPAEQPAMRGADQRLRQIFSPADTPGDLVVEASGAAPADRARQLLAGRDRNVTAVLYGDLHRPTVLFTAGSRGDARFLATLAEQTLRSAGTGDQPLSQATLTAWNAPTATAGGHRAAATAAVFGVFFLTFLLAGQVIAGMTEERNNKVIEVLAAAVPLEAVFFGKLIGMFGSAILFILFWGTLLANVGHFLPPRYAVLLGTVGPAVGAPLFTVLFFVYFSMSYLLLGGVFLGLGAQASNPRALQMMSLPITILQVATFSFAFTSIGNPDSWKAWVAMIFPLSSPFTMAGRAAASPELWPHVLAIGWQLLWVVIVVTVGARMFKRGVLQSGNTAIGFKGLFRRGT